MKSLYILKIGGSVATYKNRIGFSIQRFLLKKIAKSIKEALKKKDFNLILIHGAGACGHQLANKHNLKEGAMNKASRWKASFESRIANQKLNNSIVKIFVSKGLRAVSSNTASIIIQNNKKISNFFLETIKESIKQNCIPILYGEMVFDRKLGMTICSGDAIAPYLAKKLKAKKIIFATDVNGIFDKDPYKNKDANLIENIDLSLFEKKSKINLAGSHNIDATGGLSGKIKSILSEKNWDFLDLIEIFNGLEEKNYGKIFSEKKFPHTKIFPIKRRPEDRLGNTSK